MAQVEWTGGTSDAHSRDATGMSDLRGLFTGDLAIPRGDLSKTLARLEREGYRFRPHPIYPDVIECLASPLDVRLSAMKEFAHVARSED